METMNVQEHWQNMALDQVPLALAGHEVPWVREARLAAFERFAARGFPTRRDEAWKYTDLSILAKRASFAPDNIPPDAPSEAALNAWMLSRQNVHLMVFVNGHYSPELSYPRNLGPGVQLESLAGMLDENAQLPPELFDAVHEHTVLDALNTAFTTDGAVLRLAPGTRLKTPVYLLYIASGYGVSIYPRNIILAGEGAEATVIEHYMGTLDAHNFTDAVTQLELASGVTIDHCKLVQEGSAAFHIAGVHARQKAGSRFVSHSFALGGKLVRNDITSSLDGPDCDCRMNGLYLLNGRQQADHHTCIDHQAPRGTSRECYRGVLDGASRGVFDGKVIVRPGAEKTDAHQSNRNLLLSRQAEVDTKPQLEIYADEVKCTHGATVGQLDEDSLFYMQSRGIDAETARSLLVYGFLNDVIERVPVSELRSRIVDMVLDRLPQGESIKELL
ncbi:Fe-S cluster assembly protein SufD [Novimethylophilus kurashikiensis]|uniref:Fe-S cluster assembly protein SufD n=1 Tax=Novimethylophilus kurashikiensis TaxID=1825523 RepID=A0A2R5F207_9PROT|nr:Fe-S cluster assembly protein SufD [Novimethylophilus kurashikiensis]GBG12687.1 Fe-S cluster assembly protein SufD [Novimethylophilus kurashikiensis]